MINKLRDAIWCINLMQKLIMSGSDDKEFIKAILLRLEGIVKELKKEVD